MLTETGQSLVGRYTIGQGEFMTISERDRSLYYQRGSGRLERLVALSPTVLSFANSDLTFRFSFEIEPAGKAKLVRMALSCEPAGTAAALK